tara:strand:- start:52 stop:3819 length:3768 start_codon:yes stop_codon:yes gene_type:complete
MAGFYENITVSAAVPNAAADAEAAKDAAVIAKNEAEAAKVAAEAAQSLAEQHKDTASGYVGTVSGAQSIADANVASTAGDKQAAEDARDLALAYRQAASVSALSAENSANSVSANAATVAGMADDINTVAGLQNTLATVAFDLGIGNTMTTIRPYMTQIDTVSGITTEVIAVAADAPDIGTVATDLTGSNNIGTVAGLAPKINTVAGLGSELNSVHDNNADITTVATSLNAGNIIANVSSSIGNVNNVGNKLAEIEAVKNALSDIAAVENKLTEIDNVSDSITNVETVAGVISEVQTVAGVSNEVKNLSASTGNMATLVSKLDQTNDLAGAVTDAQNSATSASSSASTASTQATAAAGSASTAATHAANLGSVAYQNLTAVAQEKAVTAVDVFVYDTSKDSDGGAWRNRTQGTSWYNEPLNTSIRGATKKFPAVAVIVAEAYKVTIYDGDDPDMPMWMVFNGGTNTGYSFAGYSPSSRAHSSIVMLNGVMTTGGSSAGYLTTCSFLDEKGVVYLAGGNGVHVLRANIVDRNNTFIYTTNLGNANVLVNAYVNDVAMTVLPNAPIDPDTGLPVPTIAVATNGGVSVIKDDGTVVSKSSNLSNYNHSMSFNIQFDGQDVVFTAWNNSSSHSVVRWDLNLTTMKSVFSKYATAPNQTGVNVRLPKYSSAYSTKDMVARDNGFTMATGDGLFSVHEQEGSPLNSLVNAITKDFNTGWMNGDIKLATLMDTTAETISAPNLTTAGTFDSYGSNLITNGEFPNNADGWGLGNDFTWDNSGRVERTSGSANSFFQQTIQITSGRAYRVRYDVTHASGNNQSTFYSDYGVGSRTIVQQYGSGSVEEYFIAHTTGDFNVKLYGIGDFRGYWDNVVIEELQGVTFRTVQADGTASIDPATFSLANGQVTITSNSPNATIYIPLTGLTVGKTYEVTFDYVANPNAGSANGISYLQYGSTQIVPTGTLGTSAGMTVTKQFVAETAAGNLSFGTYANAGQGFTIDNVSVVEAVADRSVNGNGLNIVGNVTKSAVATGAELVSYDLGGASAYLSKPNFVFPDSDCSVMFWVGDSGSDRNVLFLGDSTNNNPANGVNIWVYNGRVKSYWGGQYVYGVNGELDGGRHFVCFVRKGDTVSLYVDGEYVSKNDVPITNALSATDLAIGKGYYANGQGCTDLALLRISATAPTPEQIAKIYRDEKPLFQEGAKCTLGGDGVVDAIAYDEDTGILHVGNGSNRDEFVGLQNTDAVARTKNISTAISAVNGLVVEE